MNDHAWIQDHIEAYIADGLEADEITNFDDHIADCPECAQALADARAVDQKLLQIFADARPAPGLEDRMVQKLKTVTRRPLRLPLKMRLAVAAASVLGVGIVGAGMSFAMAKGGLPFPGSPMDNPFAFNSPKAAFGVVGSSIGGAGPNPTLAVVDASASMEQADGTVEAAPRAEELAKEMRRGAAGIQMESRANQPREKNLSNDEVGNNPDMPTNYNVDRLEEMRVPGAVNPNGAVGVTGAHNQAPPPPGAGPAGFAGGYSANGGKGGAGGGVGGRSGAQRDDIYYQFQNRGDDASKKEAKEQLEPGKGERPQQDAGGKIMVIKPAVPNYFKPGENAQQPADPKAPPAKPDQKPSPAPTQPSDGPPKEAPRANEGEKANKPTEPEAAPLTPRKIIRSGEIEFEVDDFLAAQSKIEKISTEERGVVATVNSEKLPNGKYRGTIVVRVHPDHLDKLIDKLRALGDLKSQRIGSQDVTKLYTDMDSRLRAARAMEIRLIDIIKTGGGQIKDLLVAEKELGVWRTKIEELEGEMRYYNNLISMSTLNITLSERDVRSPFGVTETEKVDMGVEVEDVEKAQRQTHEAITEAKGRIIKSELKQHAAGQFQCVIVFDASPDAAGALRDRLKQLGEVTRLEVGRTQQTEGPAGKVQDLKVTREEVRFNLSLFNVINIAPRETVQLTLSCTDPEEAYKKILSRVQKSTGSRVVTHNLDRQRNEQTNGTINFEVKTNDASTVLTDVQGAGEVVRMQVVENPDTQNVTKSKRGFQIRLVDQGMTRAREQADVQLAAKDVAVSYKAIQDAVLAAKGRVIHAQLNEQDRRNITGDIVFEVRRSDEAKLATAVKGAGDTISRKVSRIQDGDMVVDTKVAMVVRLMSQTRIPPRETNTMRIEVKDVERAKALLAKWVEESKGRMADSKEAHEPDGTVTAVMAYDVPLAAGQSLVEKLKNAGILRTNLAARNSEVPDGDLAIARINVTLSNAAPLVASDKGLWDSVKTGLSWSLTLLLWSLMWIITGVVFLGPWALVGYGIYRLFTRGHKEEAITPPPAPAA